MKSDNGKREIRERRREYSRVCIVKIVPPEIQKEIKSFNCRNLECLGSQSPGSTLGVFCQVGNPTLSDSGRRATVG